MKIGDLVHLNRDANFSTAIDLSDFRSESSNRELCASFCFAKLNDRGELGSYDWLKMVSGGLANGNRNIWSLTANYGHGKTHFGVVLANYFGQPWGSPELTKIEELLGQVSSPAHAEQILEWRKAHPKPYFTLCLQGHRIPNLRQAVFQEVERELQRHEATRDILPPLWQAKALRWLYSLQGDALACAEQWADSHSRDLGDVRQSLVDQRSDSGFRLLMDELSAHVNNGFSVAFGDETTVRELLDHLHAHHCGPEGVFSGVAVLFDEFHVFIDNVARHPQPGDSLQDLFEAILSPAHVKNGSAVFIALGTMDPDAAARRAGRTEPDNPLAKQLNRIPVSGSRFLLRSELEAVLDGLLAQQPAWDEYEATVSAPIRDATFLTYDTFRQRLQDDLKYNADDVREKVTKGAFPLHPITTLLLSNLKFEVVQNPRGVLDFVKDQYARSIDQEAAIDGRPNWVVANELYKDFSPMFKADLKTQVGGALDSLGGDGNDEHAWVLAAMTLIRAASLPTPRKKGGYALLVGEIADMDTEIAEQTLEDLVRRGIIEFERVSGAYRFFAGANRAQFETALRKVRGNVRLDTLSVEGLSKLVSRADSDLLSPRPTPVDWGTSSDWAFRRVIVTRAQLTGGILPHSAQWNEPLTANGTRNWIRGLEVLFLPLTVDDLEWIKAEGADQIRKAYPNLPEPPVVIVTYPTPATAVEAAMVDVEAITKIDDNDVKLLGGQYREGVTKVEQELKRALASYVQGKAVRIVAPGLKSTVEAAGDKSPAAIGGAILARVYAKGPAKFSTTSQVGSTTHVNACAKLAARLLANEVPAVKVAEPNGPAMSIAEHFLRNAWGMLGADYLLRTPTDARILNIWAELHNELPAGTTRELGPLLRKFVNPPYGFDTCSLALVVCGWLGNQGREVRLTLDGPTTLSTVAGDGKLPTILGNLLRLRVKREDVGEQNARSQKIISDIEGGVEKLSRAEADEAIKTLEAFSKQPLEGWGDRANGALTILKADREKATKYVGLVVGTDEASNEPLKLLERIDAAGKASLGVIDESWPAPSVVRDKYLQRLYKLWDLAGTQQAEIKDLGSYEKRRDGLRVLERKAKEYGVTAFADQVGTTISKLDERKKQLETASLQKGFEGELKGFQPKKQSLLELRDGREVFLSDAAKLAPLAPEVQAKLDAKIEDIELEIANLVQSDGGVNQALAEASGWRAVQSIQRDLERLAERLVGTPELVAVEENRKAVNAVRQNFERLGEIEEAPPEKRSNLTAEIQKAQKVESSNVWPAGLRAYGGRVAVKLGTVEIKRVRDAEKEFEKQERAIESSKATVEELEQLRRFFLRPSEYLSSEVRARSEDIIKSIDEKLARRSVERIRSIASTLKGDRRSLLDLADYLHQLAEES